MSARCYSLTKPPVLSVVPSPSRPVTPLEAASLLALALMSKAEKRRREKLMQKSGNKKTEN